MVGSLYAGETGKGPAGSYPLPRPSPPIPSWVGQGTVAPWPSPHVNGLIILNFFCGAQGITLLDIMLISSRRNISNPIIFGEKVRISRFLPAIWRIMEASVLW
jgi:hypothetical protein